MAINLEVSNMGIEELEEYLDAVVKKGHQNIVISCEELSKLLKQVKKKNDSD